MDTTVAPIVISRDDLIARLTEQKAIAEQHDKDQLVAHRLAERAARDKFRAMCRDALTWTYEQCREHSFTVGFTRYGDERPPTCPLSVASQFERAIKSLSITTQAKFTLAPDSPLHNLLMWTPEPIKTSLC